ncbi:hypothetical protein G7054_g9530 [Neopestalotiopsis clavispora]|nr:hypothetical protein G7054_g9530 [Neopestalotiopsis clavispora]
MEKKMQTLQDAVDKITAQIPRANLPHQNDLQENFRKSHLSKASPNSVLSSPDQHGHSWDVTIDPQTGIAAAPGSCITPAANSSPFTRRRQLDLVSKGVVEAVNAAVYFDTYQNRLDHFVYSLIGDQGNDAIDAVSQSSPILAAAICTVGALHSGSQYTDYEACRKELVDLSERMSFAISSSLDDIKALCVGAFWLADLSWPFASLAVRLATELQLHKSFAKAIDGDKQHYVRARLYYHVYVCDHHASIAFGRPPLTRESEAIRNVRHFLKSKHATEDDARLVSQVCRWSLLSTIYDTFGVDVDRPLSAAEVPQVRKLAVALDDIRAEWSDKFAPNTCVGNYPRKGVTLQYYFAKLYLCSHAFRGQIPGNQICLPPDLLIELHEIADIAVSSALSILRYLVADSEAQGFLNGLPTYFHIMVTFAVVFLIKVSNQPLLNVRLHKEEVKSLVEAISTALQRVTSTMHRQHLLVSTSRGIGDIIQRAGAAGGQTAPILSEFLDERHNSELWGQDFTFDPYFLGTFDFQSNQLMDFDTEPE